MVEDAAHRLRIDIQALRGVAVLAVVFYHAGIGLFEAGYLGVDVFFVLSGFLITGLIARELDAGTFSLRRFYSRRIRRLLPAASVTVLGTVIASRWLLAAYERSDIKSQAFGALTFTANYRLRTGDYFGAATELKPLLHTWSLSLEEQFYVVVPVLLMLAGRRWRDGVIIALLFGSLGALAWRYGHPDSFYGLHTRAWELLIGSIAALHGQRPEVRAVAVRLQAPASIGLLGLCLVELPSAHPGPAAALVCLATAIVVVARPAFLNDGIVTTTLAWVGTISYSLYLVHWPLFAFLRNTIIDANSTDSRPIAFTLIVVSVVMAWGLHRVIEAPLRTRFSMKAVLITTFGLSASAMAIAWHVSNEALPQALLRQGNRGLAKSCDVSGPPDFSNDECRRAGTPKVLVWGDSHAMHLIPGLVAARPEVGFIQATSSSCAPLITSMLTSPRINDAKAERCAAFNAHVLKWLAGAGDVETVVLASAIRYGLGADVVLVDIETRAPLHKGATPAQLAEELARTVTIIKQLGKRVVFVSPPPWTGNDHARCGHRRTEGLLVLDTAPDCRFSFREYQSSSSDILEVLSQLESRHPGVVFDLGDALCNDEHCRAVIDGVPIYRDPSHLSIAGSTKAIPLTGLANTVVAPQP